MINQAQFVLGASHLPLNNSLPNRHTESHGIQNCPALQADSIRAASHAVLPRLSPRPTSPRSEPGGRLRESSSDSESDRRSVVSHVSHMSEAQRSLASITSLMSTDMRRARPQRARRQSQVTPSDSRQLQRHCLGHVQLALIQAAPNDRSGIKLLQDTGSRVCLGLALGLPGCAHS